MIFVNRKKEDLKKISACGGPTIYINITKPGSTDLGILNTPYMPHVFVNRVYSDLILYQARVISGEILLKSN